MVPIPKYNYVDADVHLDPKGDGLPRHGSLELPQEYVQSHAALTRTAKKNRKAIDPVKPRDIETEVMNRNVPKTKPLLQDLELNPELPEDLTAETCQLRADKDFIDAVQSHIKTDPVFHKILDNPHHHPLFKSQMD